MIIDHRSMLWRACFSKFLFMAVLAAGCQEPNPRSCIDGTCTDPTLPFCDVDGALAGEPQTCIAVTCTPGEFEACRGDQALTCNTEGTSYDLIQCPKGCDGLRGCRVCDPNQTVCANGKVQTCDANGAVVDSETCPLGCFEDEPRCTKLVPSNLLAQYVEMAKEAPALDVERLGFETLSGIVKDLESGTLVPLPTFTLSQPNAPSIRLFLASSANLRSVRVSAAPNGDFGTGPAFALVVGGALHISGPIDVRSGVGEPTTGCTAERGHFRYVDAPDPYLSTGPGGGGNATAGGSGGGVSGYFPSARGGAAIGNEQIVPLQGGCPGGDVEGRGVSGPIGVIDGGFGGAAVQLVSATEIVLEGKIDVRGARGGVGPSQEGIIIGAGAAGGSVLLEAPTVTMTDRAMVIAKGGGGASFGHGPSPDDSATPDPGLNCDIASGPCSPGGNGGVQTAAPTSASDVTRPGNAGDGFAGGGGGAVGRLRVNTRTGTYSKTNMTRELAATTSGTVQTE